MRASRSLVSVMIPCYESADTLPRALASLAAQSLDDWECVVVDDGSTDHPRDVVERFDDRRVRFDRFDTNLGRGAARQRALELARGKYLCMLDADDWYFPDKLALQTERMERDADLRVLSGSMAIVDEGRRLDGLRPRATPDGTSRVFDRLACPPVPHAPSMVLLERARQHRYDPTLTRSQDTDWMLRLLRGGRYAVLPEAVYAYCETPSAFGRKIGRSTLCTMRLFWKHRRRRPLAAAARVAQTAVKGGAYALLLGLGLGRRVAAGKSRPPTEDDRLRYDAAWNSVERVLAERLGVAEERGELLVAN